MVGYSKDVAAITNQEVGALQQEWRVVKFAVGEKIVDEKGNEIVAISSSLHDPDKVDIIVAAHNASLGALPNSLTEPNADGFVTLKFTEGK